MDHETQSVDMGTRNVVKYALVLIWVAVWTVLSFFTDLPAAFGGTSREQMFAMAVVTGIPFVIVYAIAAPLAARVATRAFEQTRARR